jgi:hypothetical protein
MSSVVLNQQSASDQLYASSLLTGSGGVVSSGGLVAKSVTASATNEDSIVKSSVTGNGVGGADAVLSLSENSATLSQIQYDWRLGSGGGGAATPEGVLALDAYVASAFGQSVVTVGPNPAGRGGALANQAIFGLTAPAQAGTALIPANQNAVNIANPNITATSVIILGPMGGIDDKAFAFSAAKVVGVGFTILANDLVDGAFGKEVSWVIVKY